MPALRNHTGRVAASTRTRHLVAGPGRAGQVLGAFPAAVYVGFPAEGGGELVAVETADGLRLPCAATLAAASGAGPLQAVRAGDDACVGDGRLVVGPLVLDVVRWWSPRPPRTVSSYDDARLDAVSQLLPALSQDFEARLGSLTTALAASAASDVPAAASALLGLGAGLTPLGDDLLAGLLVTLAAAPGTRLLARHLGAVVAGQAVTRTTTLSTALLRDAADGFAVPALVDLVDALHGAEHTDLAGRPTTHRTLTDVVVRLLAVGHTSGAALAHGALAAARLHTRMPVQPTLRATEEGA
jgi:Protein of unknown function (DUF2877)